MTITGGKIEYYNNITVASQSSNETGDNNNEPVPENDVPEFSTLAAIMVLAGAGYFIQKKRKSI